jgi:hypothetical protein
MKAVLIFVLALALHLSTTPPPAHAQPSCRFVLGFATLRDLVGAQKVGTCLEDEHFNLENGNAEQRTSGGLLVWRKADNFTAFTDGGSSWVNGPNGLQSRPNTERFAWEKDPVQSAPAATQALPALREAAPTSAPPIASQTAPTATPRPLPTATPIPAPTPSRENTPDPALMSQCVTSAANMAEQMALSGAGDAFAPLLGICQLSVRKDGARGFTCFESAFGRSIRMAGRLPAGSGNLAANAAQAEYNLCVGAR